MNRTVVASTFAALVSSVCLLPAADPEFKLPAPYHSPNAANGAKVIPRPETARLRLPDGFVAEEFASGFQKPRVMIALPDGSILVSDSVAKGAVVHVAKGTKRNLLEGLDRPYGLALWKDYLYVAEPTSIKRYKFDARAVTASGGEEVVSLAGFDKGHWTRALVFSPKGDKLYIGVGSGSNADPDTDERRATILECNPDGKACTVFASGLRNPTGLHFRPGTNELWATVQERDGLGDDLVPDFFVHVKRGEFYGWPYAYFGQNEDPRNAGKQPDLVRKSQVPDVSLGAHTAVIDWTFYTGKQFPAKYRNGAFFALRGSSNRAKRVGYSVAFLPFSKDGKPAARETEEFLSGWMLGADQREVWGRPTGILQLKDGSLLVSEDGNNRIWRVSYGKSAAMVN